MLSSHIMQEVEAVCNRVIIINKGKIVADGGINEIKSGKLNRNQVVIAEFSASPKLEKLLAIEGVKSAAQIRNLWEIESDGEKDIRPAIFQFSVENNLTLLTLQEKQQNLEGVFHELTQNPSFTPWLQPGD
jgi:ABC-2 type transport system ATP-binding protein